jgi:hypothetical protein
MSNGRALKPSTQPGEQPVTKGGITVADVLAVFPGAKVVAEDKPLLCRRCNRDHIPAWRRGGKIVERVWPDGRKEWACDYCGRAHDGGNRIVSSEFSKPKKGGKHTHG